MTAAEPAPVARFAARAAAGGTWALDYAVAHLTAGEVPDRTRPQDPRSPFGEPDETLRLTVAGTRFDLATWPSRPDAATDHQHRAATVLGRRPSQADHGWLYGGSVVLNPGFQADWTGTLEVLLTLGPAPWQPTYRHAHMTTLVIREVCEAAADAGLPVLSLTAPAAPHSDAVGATRGDGSGEKLRAAIAPCVRVGVGVAGRARDRLTFERRLLEFATARGIGLRFADPRSTSRGEWFTVAPLRSDVSGDWDELAGDALDGPPAEAVPVTVLGPARLGSTATIAQWLSRSNVGVLGASVTVLRDVAVQHYLLPVAPARLGATGLVARTSSVVEGLGRIASLTGLTTAQATERQARKPVDIRPVIADHVLLTGSPVPCVFERRPSRAPKPSQARPAAVPLWISWDLPFTGIGTEDVIGAVTDLIEPQAEVEVSWLRSRRSEHGRLVGRAKLAVAPPGEVGNDGLIEALDALASRVQYAAADRLALQVGPDVWLQVVRRERALARLGADPGPAV